MRVVAALMVFFFHIGQNSPFQSQQISDAYETVFGQGGWVGVSFFFILSGFVLTWSAKPGDTARRFWRRRAAKVFPNHLVTTLAALLLLAIAGQSLGGWKILPAAFLLQSWFPQLDISGAANSVSWSLSCELLFYASFPLIIRFVDRVRPSRLWYGAGATWAAILAAPLIAQLLPSRPGVGFAPASEAEFWFVYVLPPVRTLDFLLGIFLARILQRGRWIHFNLGAGILIAVASYILCAHVGFTYGLAAVTAMPLALVITAAAHADLHGGWSPFRSAAMVWLGNVSFAFYLWHKMILIEVRRRLGGPLTTWDTAAGLSYIALAGTLTMLVAWATYRYVEIPAMRRWSTPRTPRARHATPAQPLVRVDGDEGADPSPFA
ncbi:acyltransferase family protein [Streptomyces sp. NBC_00009]|uniref:acyltransferase family protein n=1 Tax=Streptomyces sp. NBC_00009 TaxID=2975620 RepID=UPI0038658861